MIKLDQQFIKPILKERKADSHKGNYGHALLIAGSKGKIGAAVLSARACLRSGVGLLTVHIPGCGMTSLHETIPEAMLSLDSNEDFFSDLIDPFFFDCVGIGPGIGKNGQTQNAFYELLKKNSKPMVLDADAINILSLNKDYLKIIPKNSILTPHLKEFERLVGSWKDDQEKTKLQMAFSKNYQCVVVLKGPHTLISDAEGNLFENTTGNSGMAKGGSGDALTGMITAFLAQGSTSVEAAQLGVYLHGLAGDLAVQKYTEYSLLTSDLIEFIPEAFKDLQKV